MKNKMLIGFIIALVIVGAGSFYGGMVYGKSKGGAKNSVFGQRQGLGANGAAGVQTKTGNRAGGSGFVNGSIIAQDDKSLTVKSADGGSKIVFLSSKTQIMKSVSGSVSDLAVGQNVMVNGSTNSDGSITAQVVQLRPAAPVGGPANATTTPPTR